VEGVEDSAKAARFLALNRNKRSVRLNLKDPEGVEAFLTLAETADVVLESFRPGVLARLGCGFEALRVPQPRASCTARSRATARTGRSAIDPGHDMNYLGLVGLLGLTGEAGGPPVQAAGQIADLGGGALMAAFGILAALRERDRSGEGQLVDVSMADGALSWLAMDAVRSLLGEPQRRGEMELGGRFLCYRPYACADGWVTLGALEPKFFGAWCRGVGREDLAPHQFDPRDRPPTARWRRSSPRAPAASGRPSRGEVDCCLEPVLELEEALDSPLVRAREMVVAVEQPGRRGARADARGAREALAHARRRPPPPRAGPGAGHARVLRAAGYDDERLAALEARGAIAGPPGATAADGPG
jgi:crotonobetainyl-CoA:carnitine CoA-transferase CaiB-like acyl-CoA transferase